jgi:threonine dehydrogenase-like Zn-dependent dehydrogenase
MGCIAARDRNAAIGAALETHDGHGCERVIEAGGEQATLDLASALCAEGGRMMVAGYHQDGSRQVDIQQWNWRGLDVINAHERDPAAYVAGMAAAIDAVASGQLEPDALYTHRVPFERASEAFEALRDRPDGFVKAVVTP